MAKSWPRLRRQHLQAVLAEVVIEGKGLADPERLHDDEADRIGEGEDLVGVTAEEGATRVVLLPACKDDGGAKFFQPTLGRLPVYASYEQGVSFRDYEIGGDEGLARPLQLGFDRSGIGMVGIISVGNRKKRTGVD